MSRFKPTLDANAYFSALNSQNAPTGPLDLGAAAEDKKAELDAATQDKIDSLRRLQEQRALADQIPGGDLAASFGMGAGNTVGAVGALAGLVTGDMDNALSRIGDQTRKYWEQGKSNQLGQKEANRADKIGEEDSEWAKAGVAFWETVKDPSLLANLAMESVPSLVLGGAAGRAAGAGVKAATGSEVFGAAASTGTALGTSAAEQGGSVVKESYERLMDQPEELWEQNPQYLELREELGAEGAKDQIAREMAGAAGLAAAGTSLATQRLPGGMRLDKVLAGTSDRAGNLLGNVVKGTLGEAAQEIAEEGSGQFLGNLAQTVVDPNQRLSQGIGEAAGLAAAAGGALGGVGGIADTRAPEIRENEAEAQQKKAAVNKAASEAKKSGVVDALMEEGEAYDPFKAATISLARVNDENLSEDERTQAKADLTKAKSLVESDLETAKKEVDEELTEEQAVAEKISRLEDTLKYIERAREYTLSGGEGGIAIDTLNEAKGAALAKIDSAKENSKITLENETKRRVDRLAALEKQSAQLSDIAEQQQAEARPAPEAINSLVEAAEATEETPERAEAVDTVIKLAMRDPRAITPETAQRLAENPNIPEEARTLFKAFDEANAAANARQDVKSVSANVLEGREGFKGLKSYQVAVGEALNNDQPEAAKAELQQLKDFSNTHSEKLAKLEEARAEVEATGQTRYLERQEDGSYVIKSKKPWRSEKGRQENGGLYIAASNKGRLQGDNLINAIGLEVQAIEATGKQLAAAVRLSAAQATQETTSVQETPATPDVPSAPPVEDDYADVLSQVEANEVDAEPVTEAPVIEESVTAAEATPEPAGTVEETEQVVEREETDDEALARLINAEPVAQDTAEDGTTASPQESDPEIIEALDEGITYDQEDLVDPAAQNTNYLSKADLESGESTALFPRVFTKREAKGATQSPLTAIKGWFSNVTDGGLQLGIVDPFSDKTVTERDRVSLADFLRFVTEHKDAALARLDVQDQNPTYDYLNPVAGIRDENGNIPENLATAIIYGAFQWLAKNPQPRLNTDEDIKRMLGLGDGEFLSFEQSQQYRNVGFLQATEERSIGQAVAKAFGYGPVAGADSDAQAKFELALGQQAMRVLSQAGLVTTQQLPFGEDQGPANYIKPTKEEELLKEALNRAENVRMSNGFVDRLMSNETAQTFPPSEPSFNPKTPINNSRRAVPEVQAERLTASDKNPMVLSETMGELRQAFTPSQLETMSGADKPEFEHVELAEGRAAAAQSIKDELQYLNEFRALQGDKPFFPTPTVWSQQRSGLASSLLNYQQNKSQRFDMAMEAWKTSFAPTDTETADLFKLAVAQGLGLEVDKQSNSKTLEELNALLDDPNHIFTQAIAVLRKPKLDGNDAEIVVKAVLKAKQDMHALQSLAEMARFLNTPQDGSFETSIAIEVDGVANGPALSQILLGAANQSLGAIYGFFNAKDGVTNFPEFADAGQLDIYERVGEAVKRYAEGKYAYYFHKPDGTGMRKIFKGAVTPITFSAGMRTVQDAMAIDVVQRLYAELESIANSDDTNASKRDRMNHAINMFNTTAGKQFFSFVQSPSQGLQLKLTPPQMKAFQGLYRDQVGEAIEQGIESEMKDFLDRRTSMNEMASAIWTRYNEAFTFLVDKRVKDLVAAGTIQKNKVDQPIQSLSTVDLAAIRKELKGIIPIVHTAMSQGGTLNAGLDIEKMVFSAAVQDATTKVETAFAGEGKNGKSAKRSGYAARRTSQGPGAKIIPILTHALDSAIASAVYSKYPAMNVHDAVFVGLKDVDTAATAMNKATLDVLTNYSMPGALVDALDRSIKGQDAIVEKYPDLQQVFDNAVIEQTLGGERVPVNLNDWIEGNRDDFLNWELSKLEFLAQVTHVNQYGWQNGAYELTVADRERIEKRITEIKAKGATEAPELSAVTDLDDIETGPEQADGVANTGRGQPVPQERPSPKRQEAPAGPATGYWNGTRGRPLNEVNAALAALFKANPRRKVSEVLPVLRKEIAKAANSPEQKKFLSDLLTVMNRNAKLKDIELYVSAERGLEEGTRALTSVSAESTSIELTDAQYADQGMNIETIMHELVHAATAGAVNDARTNKGEQLTDAQRDAVANLKQVFAAAQQYVAQNNLTQFNEAVTDLDEMLAWGLTNKDFQQEVLGKITLNAEIKSLKGRVTDGLTNFIRSVAALLFKNRATDYQTRGLYVLMTNAPVLFSQSSKLVAAGSATQLTLDLPMKQSSPMTFTSEQIFEALANNPVGSKADPVHAKHLKRVLQRVVSTIYAGDSALRGAAHTTAPTSADDVFLQARVSGQTPFASEAAANLRTNDQEAFVMESVELAMREALKRSPSMYRDMRRLYNEAKKFVKPADLPNGEWEFLFEQSPENFLPRFVAAAMAYAPLVAKLQEGRFQGETGTFAEQESFAAKISLLFTRLMEFLHAKVLTGLNKGDRYDVAVGSLAHKMATIEAKAQTRLSRIQAGAPAVADRIEDALNNGGNKIRDGLVALGQNPKVRGSSNALIKGTGVAAATVFGETFTDMAEFGIKVRNSMAEGRLGLIASLVNEGLGERDSNKSFYALLNLKNRDEQTILRTKEEAARRVQDMFGEKLTKEDSAALNNLLRTDMSIFVGTDGAAGIKSIQDIRNLLLRPKVREDEIRDYEAALTAALGKSKAAKYLDDYVSQAKALGYFMMTGEAKSDHLMLNAYNIVTLRGTNAQGTLEADKVEQVTELVDKLTSLYALRYMPDLDKSRVAALIEREYRKPDEKNNGVATVLRNYKAIQKHARDEEFAADPTQMIKGYTLDITNPYIEHTVVTVGSIEERNVIAAGYAPVGNALPRDPADPSMPKRMYVIRGKGLGDAITGIMGGAAKQAKGTNAKIDGFRKTVKAGRGRSSTWDPSSAKETHVVPVMRSSGDIKNYRYMMTTQVRDSVLERTNDVSKTIGAMTSRIASKQKSISLNSDALQLMKDTYDAEYLLDPNAFIKVSADSKDPQIAERYRTLPKETQMELRSIWGGDSLYVRRDLYDITFGYRKFSLGDMFAKIYTDRNAFEKIFVMTAERFMGAKAARKVIATEDVFAELVRVVKDIWVIRNLTTLVFNEVSNISVLVLRGVPLSQIISGKFDSWMAVKTYRANEKRIADLQVALSMDGVFTDPKQRVRAENEIGRLTADNSSSPIDDVMKAGMYTTIVEDIRVGTEENPYSYHSRLAEGMSKYTKRIPQGVKDATNVLMVNHGTTGYEALKHATMMSDFSARYTLHKYQTKETNRNVMSKEESLRIARAAFVNYDVPTHRGVQYLNDMGILPFTKYYIRIQRSLLEGARSNPARALMTLVLGDLLDLPTILDSSFFHDPLPGSLSYGAFELPGAIGEIATFKGFESVID